jgi:hypothetical protein
LRADPDELRARLRRRGGPSPEHDTVEGGAKALDGSTFADWCIETSDLSIEEVASRVLGDLGDWPPAGSPSGSSSPGVGAPPGGEILWVTGTTGVGKSTVGFRAYLDVLGSGGHAAYVDVGQVGFCSTAPEDHSLRARNLAALWRNFHDVGARLAIVVGGVSQRSDVRQYEKALPNTRLSWCQLEVGEAELTKRILSRSDGGSWSEPGDGLRDRPRDELLEIADRAIAAGRRVSRRHIGLHIDVDGLGVEDAAVTLLRLARWPSGSSALRSEASVR